MIRPTLFSIRDRTMWPLSTESVISTVVYRSASTVATTRIRLGEIEGERGLLALVRVDRGDWNEPWKIWAASGLVPSMTSGKQVGEGSTWVQLLMPATSCRCHAEIMEHSALE